MPSPSRSNRMSRGIDKVMKHPATKNFVKAAGMASQDSAMADEDRGASNAKFAEESAGMGALSEGYEGFGILKKE